jgi:hypothetical protein
MAVAEVPFDLERAVELGLLDGSVLPPRADLTHVG